eukprot:6029895-Alexandrium_andersonii.AAC.1
MPGLASTWLARGSGPSHVAPRTAACTAGAAGPLTGSIASTKSQVRPCMTSCGVGPDAAATSC